MAYNPFDFFRRNQKTAFAALTVFVMFTFVLSFGQGDFFQWLPGWLGSFKKTGHDYTGQIVTLSVQAKGVRIAAESERSNDAAPSHRVFVGKVEIGAAWSRTSNDGRAYLSLKLDDPSFMAPIYANLFDDDDGETAQLIWSRSRKANGD